ncbi:MAG TPA: trehalase family glycosidase [Pseudonocardiaceae bacterium]
MPASTTRPRRAALLACSAGLLVTTILTTGASPAASADRPATTTVGPAVANQDNLSPTARTLTPVAVQSSSGGVTSPTSVLSGGTTQLAGIGAQLVLDFGKEVGGITTLSFAGASPGQQLDLGFSETTASIGQDSDKSNPNGTDGHLTATVGGPGGYTVPTDKQRGGFRYLTLYLETGGSVGLNGVSLNYTAAPGVADPADYANYFSSNDETLNKIWYAGAYTVQLDTIGPTQGRAINVGSGWENNADIGPTTGVTGGPPTSVLTDGAKRDRTVWAGDLGIALPTEYASTDDVTSGGNGLAALWQHQAANGELPYEGPPTPASSVPGSDTYHLWAMIGTSDYYDYSDNIAWLRSIWPKYQNAMSFILSRMDNNTGLLAEASGETGDWAGTAHGAENIEVNALMYEALVTGARLAGANGDSADVSSWQQKAIALRDAVNAKLWNPAVGLYLDSTNGGVYPQDGNALAVWFGLTTAAAQNQQISQALTSRWSQVGAVSPEVAGLVGTFPGSMEVQAHFVADDDVTALQLIRREWGYQLSNQNGPQSTFWESYRYDGGSYYAGSYASFAHGWATGPTSALTFYVLGLMADAPSGQYTFIPHAGDLTHVEGDITLPQGKVNGVWDYSATDGTFTEKLTSPAGTTGEIGVPTHGAKNVSVTVNGATVWSNGTFQATTGITGGSSDGNYVYLTGVAPGSYTVAGSGVHAPQAFSTSVLPNQLPPGYTRCGAEGDICTPNGTQVLAYGAGAYSYQVITGPTSCANGTFGGDPAPNLVKSCYLAPLGGPSGFTQCATEGGTCQVNGTGDVAFGVNGAYRFMPVSGGVACTDAAFGADPLVDKVKNCYVSNGAPPGNWAQCAAEKSTCDAAGTQPVAIGADGAYAQGLFGGPTTCTADLVGSDPLYGTAKSCYLWTGLPAGFGNTCAAENGTCSFPGEQTVAFGADGSFTYAPFTGGTPCTRAAFGGRDPLPNVAKNCYLVG